MPKTQKTRAAPHEHKRKRHDFAALYADILCGGVTEKFIIAAFLS